MNMPAHDWNTADLIAEENRQYQWDKWYEAHYPAIRAEMEAEMVDYLSRPFMARSHHHEMLDEAMTAEQEDAAIKALVQGDAIEYHRLMLAAWERHKEAVITIWTDNEVEKRWNEQ